RMEGAGSCDAPWIGRSRRGRGGERRTVHGGPPKAVERGRGAQAPGQDRTMARRAVAVVRSAPATVTTAIVLFLTKLVNFYRCDVRRQARAASSTTIGTLPSRPASEALCQDAVGGR